MYCICTKNNELWLIEQATPSLIFGDKEVLTSVDIDKVNVYKR